MQRERVLRLIRENRDKIKSFGVESLAVFGSVARGEASPESDIDILVTFYGPATFDQYMELKFFLEKLLDRPVDLVTRKALKPQLKAQIEREAIYVS
ncbi:DNA polymerase subunit beta [Candidatus Acetothermia bacterium]|nr:MAG: DNA polymerase subunit beta [Candidatus Acetothermia bacterium]